MENLDLKKKILWDYEYWLEISEIMVEVYKKTENKIFYDYSLEFYNKAKIVKLTKI